MKLKNFRRIVTEICWDCQASSSGLCAFHGGYDDDED